MKLSASRIRKIAIFRALQLGDMLSSIPAIRALRRAYPEAHITLIGLPWAAKLTERFPAYFDSFIAFPGFPGLSEEEVKANDFLTFLEKAQNEKFDLVIQLHNNGWLVNNMLELLGAKYLAGFYTKLSYCPNDILFMGYPVNLTEVERNLLFMQYLGVPTQGNELEFPLTAHDEADIDKLSLLVKQGTYICIHPGSHELSQPWSPAYFAALGDYFARHGLQVLVMGARGGQEMARQIIRNMTSPAVNISGKTSLGAMAGLIRDAYALITNSAGVSHIASALKTQSIVIDTGGEPNRWSLSDKNLLHLFDWNATPDFNLVMQGARDLLRGHPVI